MNAASKTSKVPLIAEYTLSHLGQHLKEKLTKEFSEEDLLTLHSVFGVVLQRALDILEKQPTFIAYTSCKTLRTLIEVKGENDRCYRVFPKINFCPCRAFQHQVIEKKAQVFCKHVLVARLAHMLSKTVPHEVTEEQYSMLVRSMFDLEVKPENL